MSVTLRASHWKLHWLWGGNAMCSNWKSDRHLFRKWRLSSEGFKEGFNEELSNGGSRTESQIETLNWQSSAILGIQKNWFLTWELPVEIVNKRTNSPSCTVPGDWRGRYLWITSSRGCALRLCSEFVIEKRTRKPEFYEGLFVERKYQSIKVSKFEPCSCSGLNRKLSMWNKVFYILRY